MTLAEFKVRRCNNRKQLLAKIIADFISCDPIAIHLFGSGAKGFTDEFSDIDIWVTFSDKSIKGFLKKQPTVLNKISPALVKHYSKTWSPVGGSATSIIYDINGDLTVVDCYVAKKSETILKPEAKVIYGLDSFARGEWKLNRHINDKLKDTHTIKKDIDLLLNLIFISYKGILRQWPDDSFITNLKGVHQKFRQRYPDKLPIRQLHLSFASNERLLKDLNQIVNKRQQAAIRKISQYAKLIEALYFGR